MTAPALSARGLSKRYGRGDPALQPLDLDVPSGRRLALLGDNGAGKSTLLRLAAGLLRPTSGAVHLFGQPADAPRARARLGYLPERAPLPPDLRPLELLVLCGRLSGVVAPRERAHDLLVRLGLEPHLARPVRALSTGMRQRLGLAQALLHEPDLLLLDEPLTALDAAARALARELLIEACARGATLVLTTHRLVDVGDLCDHVAVMTAGRLRDLGPASAALAALPARVHFVLPPGVADPQVGVAAATSGATRVRAVRGEDRDALLGAVAQAGGRVLQVEPVLGDTP